MSGAGEEFQRHITTQLLNALGDVGFALAGAGAIRAHGLTDRPTHDVDLFTQPRITGQVFRAAVVRASAALREAGHEVTPLQESDTFARVRILNTGGQVLDVDFAVNWRADPPVQMSFGPVLSERDAVAGKLSAVYSRGEVRDFLDLDAIRASGRYTDEELLALGTEHDAGFDRVMFAAQLSRVVHFDAEEAEEYGITAQEVTAMQQRTMRWAVRLRDERPPGRRPGPARRSRPERPQDLWEFTSDPSRRPSGGPDHGRSL